ncbi:hypothetical protein SNE40_001588 [Patella caerulea]|uniref:Uncharacterized protein n=1 Tax=Patella caerulea TaxID=87958 RepID=A0AAN8Q3Q1_PATCE
MSQVMVKSSTTVTGPTALAPVPTVSAWTKPINFAVNNTGHELKFEKGDNHDSGIDVSDQPNSAASSTRSSPSAENKLKDDQKVPGILRAQRVMAILHDAFLVL